MTSIIAFVGPAGCGKTSLIRSLAASEQLDASPLFSDTYKSIAIWGPRYKALGLSDEEIIERWFQEGSPADDYCSIPQLIEDIRSLRAGRSIRTPVQMWEGGEHEIRPARYILLEDSWACRSELKGFIDHIVQISLPFDIALARYVQRDSKQGRNIEELTSGYLKYGYRYVRALENLKEHADLVLDGLKSMDELVNEVMDWITKNIEAPAGTP